MNREFKGVWIPAHFWLDESIGWMEKGFLVEIDSLQDGERGCWASNKHFADLFSVTTRTVSTILKKLEDDGYIRRDVVITETGTERRLFRGGGLEKIAEGGGGETSRLPMKNLLPRNTKKRNTSNTNIGGSSQKFIPPTLEAVKQYREEKHLLGVSPESFFGYYEDRDWKRDSGKVVKSWKLTMQDWNRRSFTTQSKSEADARLDRMAKKYGWYEKGLM